MRYKEMKKKAMVMVTVALLAMPSAMGQIIYTEEDEGLHLRDGSSSPSFGIMVPLQNSNLDQWKLGLVPVGDGLLLLAGLGGAYLLKKKMKVKSEK